MGISQADFGVALTIFSVTFVFFAYNWFGPLRKAQRESDKYKFYAIRQELVILVAEGKVSEDDEAWQFLYRGVNILIKNLDSLTLGTVVRAIRASTMLEANPIDLQKLRESQELHGIATGIFVEISVLLWRRSLFVRSAIHSRFLGKIAIASIRRALKAILGPKVEAYKMHESANRIAHALAA